MGDLTMSLLGSITGGLLVATAFWGLSGAGQTRSQANQVAHSASAP